MTRAAPGLHESVFSGAGSAAVWVPRFMLVYHHKMLQVETFVGQIFIRTDRIVLKFLRAFKTRVRESFRIKHSGLGGVNWRKEQI
jgi:hypothetical protein